jgi:flavin-dependent dehydrogenase
MKNGPGSESARRADIVVIGGGPAGASAAIEIAKAGLSVVVLERCSHGRDRPGETLHPGAEPLFEQLGIHQEVLSAGFPRHEGHWVSSSGGFRFDRFGGDGDNPWRGFQVWRAEFDEILLRRAKQLGAKVKRTCNVLKPLLEHGRVVGVATSDQIIRSRVVIDASGGRQWLARRLRLPIIKASPRLIVRYGYAERAPSNLVCEPEFISDQCGWTWIAPVKADLVAWTRLRFDDNSSTSNRLPESLQDSKDRGRVRAADVTWRIATAAAGPGYFLVGDAASVLDPASSHGLLKAMMSGMMAAHLIIERAHGRVGEARASQIFSRWTQSWFEHDIRRLKQFYSTFPDCKEWPTVNVTPVF